MDSYEDKRLNLSFYGGEDLYSDGEIENEMLEIAKNNTDFDNVIANDTRWPILYHFSKKDTIYWSGILLKKRLKY